jgi:hypothetical protein
MVLALCIIGALLAAALVLLVLPWIVFMFDRPFELYERYLEWVANR